ncbi:hypothetical protein M9H77_29023 [Catharanthus roseus]|uniref:Uncharacterized protein n=1 Tax=Catharanthus roseus TaxID=4058 RepID=A0ACC0AIZ2_CATRO|nr:hypothetical protein M9H77_29023 [Catharanthus roseus]
MGSSSPINDLVESGNTQLLDWNDSMTDIQLGMRFVEKVQAISAVFANDPEIPVSNIIQEVQVLFQTGCTYKRAWEKIEKYHTGTGIPIPYPRPWRVGSRSKILYPGDYGSGSGYKFNYKGEFPTLDGRERFPREGLVLYAIIPMLTCQIDNGFLITNSGCPAREVGLFWAGRKAVIRYAFGASHSQIFREKRGCFRIYVSDVVEKKKFPSNYRKRGWWSSFPRPIYDCRYQRKVAEKREKFFKGKGR